MYLSRLIGLLVAKSKQEKVGVLLMECLAAGRAISLPASTLGGAKVLTYATGAYSRFASNLISPLTF